jgi:REP element-mobilizing transposase RayT
MRMPRIKEEGEGYYHIISRVVDRQRILDSREKRIFTELMRSVERFSGCHVLAHTVLDNHWHILLHVPARESVDDEEFLRRLAALYDRQSVETIGEHLRECRQSGQHEAAEALRARYTYRMYELSEFVKTLKQRFTQSYNRRHERKGTLWEERFKSVLIGGSEGALLAVAGYIDLNPVRAGIVDDPKEYRFSSYGEAVGGSKRAREGLRRLMLSLGLESDWATAGARYRQLLYLQGQERGLAEDGGPLRPGFSFESVKAVLEAGGELSLPELLRCRVRYFSDGVILGSREFVDGAFLRHRRHFSPRRKTGARRMRGGDWGRLCTVRRLRRSVLSVPTRV